MPTNNDSKTKVKIIASLLDPTKEDKEEGKVSFKDILKAIKIDVENITVSKNDEGTTITLEASACKKSENIPNGTIEVTINSCNESYFPQLLQSLKSKVNEYKNKLKRDCMPLVDTCYDNTKAERLKNALESIRSKIGNNDELFKKFLLLLAAVYAQSITNANDYWKYEWFISLIRAAARGSSNTSYLPLCPSKGDIAAIFYYYLCFRKSLEEGSDENSDSSILDELISISVSDVKDLVTKITRLQPQDNN